MNELPLGELPLDKPGKAHCGWFAVSEEALRRIERTFDREGARRKAKACFITLLRIANLEGSIVFIRTIAQIAKDMSYGYSEASKALKLVEATGLCTIEQRQVAGTKELAPSQYTVSTLLGENSATLGAINLRLGERSKSSVSPRITNNSSKNEPRTSQEPPSQAQSSASPTVAGSAEKPSSASRSAKVKSLLPPSEPGLEFADWFRSTLPESVSLAKNWRDQWARAFDALVRTDKRTHEEIWRVSKWARADSFWAAKFLSPLKLRAGIKKA